MAKPLHVNVVEHLWQHVLKKDPLWFDKQARTPSPPPLPLLPTPIPTPSPPGPARPHSAPPDPPLAPAPIPGETPGAALGPSPPLFLAHTVRARAPRHHARTTMAAAPA